jgi:hypothetical protein
LGLRNSLKKTHSCGRYEGQNSNKYYGYSDLKGKRRALAGKGLENPAVNGKALSHRTITSTVGRSEKK